MTLLALFLAACTAAPANPAAVTCAAPLSASPSRDEEMAVRPTSAEEADCAPRKGLGLAYEIYVRSFQDSDGDGIGDLEGVRLRLDHLASLGVETLWLMPIFESPGTAGYDVADYDAIRAAYGTEEDLVRLVDDAHARDMRVLLDLPFNHVALTHPWFAAADADPDSPSRDRFVFSDTQWDTYRWFPATGGGFYYAFFGAALPDLNWTDALVRAQMFEAIEGWMDIVDGYRLDAVVMLVEADGAITNTDDTHALLAELYARVKTANPDARVLAEASEPDVAGNAAYLGSPGAPESDRTLDFPRREALLAAVAAGAPDGLLAHLAEQEDAASLGRTAPFLQSHDVSRLPAFVADDRARRLLQVLQLTLPGDPVLYYGEELDLADATSATGQDYAWRAPMPWDGTRNGGFTSAEIPWFTLDPLYMEGTNVAEAGADPTSLLTLIRDLACVRAEIDGAEWAPVETDAPAVLGYARTTPEGRLVVVANLGATSVSAVRVDVHGGFREITTDTGVDAGDGLNVAGLGPYGYALYAEETASRCAVAAPLG